MAEITREDSMKWPLVKESLERQLMLGDMKLDQLERFMNLTSDARDAFILRSSNTLRLASPINPTSKFEVMLDLGVISVPRKYDQATYLEVVAEKHKDILVWDGNISGVNYSEPTSPLRSGQKLRVRIFKQIHKEKTTLQERMNFLVSQNAIYPGPYGAALVFDKKGGMLSSDHLYISYDRREALPKIGTFHKVPCIQTTSGQKPRIVGAALVEVPWHDDQAIICFQLAA
jgi:hypothetical protein